MKIGADKSMFGRPKKLKKIPADLVAYIQIEAEAIETSTDKHMISSYCLDKLELVNWYLEVLSSGSTKYIVPQSKEYLEGVRDGLIEAHKQIMQVKVQKPKKGPSMDVECPKSDEG